VEASRQQARDDSCALWQAAITVVNERLLAARACNAILVFLQLVDEL